MVFRICLLDVELEDSLVFNNFNFYMFLYVSHIGQSDMRFRNIHCQLEK